MRFQSRRLRLLLLAAFAAAAACRPAWAIVIDDFSVGDVVVDGPAVYDQSELDPAHVIGGARRIDVGRFGQGSRFEVAEDQLHFGSTGFGYLTLTYGAVESLGGVDLTAGGHDRFRMRFGDVSSSPALMGLYVNLAAGSTGNGVGWTANSAWDGLIIEIPYAGFPVPFTAVQKIAFDVSRNPANTDFEIESLVTAGPSAPNDFNRDGVVDGADLAEWSRYFGVVTSVNSPKVFATSDSNSDGRVDGADFLSWQRSVAAPAAAIPVPEPAAGALLAALSMLLIIRNRRNPPPIAVRPRAHGRGAA